VPALVHPGHRVLPVQDAVNGDVNWGLNTPYLKREGLLFTLIFVELIIALLATFVYKTTTCCGLAIKVPARRKPGSTELVEPRWWDTVTKRLCPRHNNEGAADAYHEVDIEAAAPGSSTPTRRASSQRRSMVAARREASAARLGLAGSSARIGSVERRDARLAGGPAVDIPDSIEPAVQRYRAFGNRDDSNGVARSATDAEPPVEHDSEVKPGGSGHWLCESLPVPAPSE
jgi:hypothetical protein